MHASNIVSASKERARSEIQAVSTAPKSPRIATVARSTRRSRGIATAARNACRSRASWMLALVPLLAFACRVGPDYQRPDVETPAAFAGAKPSDGEPRPLAPDWWTVFNEPELDALESLALLANHDLRASAARVAEARAAARAVGGNLYPAISFDPSISRAHFSGNANANTNGHGTTLTTIALPIDLSYELDVWGRVRRTVESAEAQYAASADDFGVVLLTLNADVAQNYFALRSLDAQQEILLRSIELFRQQVDMTTTQKNAGIVGPTDVLQAQTQLDATVALETDVRRQRTDVEHALAILVGKAPSEFSLAARKLESDPPTIPTGTPADLLSQRPDVAEAEHNLVGANASIGVARAEYYPKIDLSAAAGLLSIDLQHLFDWQSRVWSLGASLAQPIYQGGRLDAQLEQAKARYDELAAAFQSTVLKALGDVENALTDIHLRAEASDSQKRAVLSAREYLRLAQLQYRQGLISYLQVIDAERTLLTNELTEAQLLNQRYASTVLLMKALGGGWTPQTADAHEETRAAVGPKS
jgi:multidrug efflux system outer membrane protein